MYTLFLSQYSDLSRFTCFIKLYWALNAWQVSMCLQIRSIARKNYIFCCNFGNMPKNSIFLSQISEYAINGRIEGFFAFTENLPTFATLLYHQTCNEVSYWSPFIKWRNNRCPSPSFAQLEWTIIWWNKASPNPLFTVHKMYKIYQHQQ